MNGTGATINFGGTNYSIDSTKLSTATNSFVSHLGTVSGNGYKVVVGGVEYNVDSSKMSNAVSQIHAVLSGMQSGEDDMIVSLLSSDNLILQDSNGVYLTSNKEE